MYNIFYFIYTTYIGNRSIKVNTLANIFKQIQIEKNE